MRNQSRILLITLLLFLAFGAWLLPSQAQRSPIEGISASAALQIEALMNDKKSRTPTQAKISSQLLYVSKMDRKQPIADGVPTLETTVPLDDQGRAVVDIAGTVGTTLIEQIMALGGEVVTAEPAYRSVRANIPLQALEAIAALPEVLHIHEHYNPLTSRTELPETRTLQLARQSKYAVSPDFAGRAVRAAAAISEALPTLVSAHKVAPFVGSKNSEGDVTHRAVNARNTFGVNGAGIKIGVLSDGVSHLAQSQAVSDLGPVTVLPGQTGNGDEGTAMLEIIHDLAPGAQLFFATAFTSINSFAQNIRNLRTAGCDIIVDDVFYFIESPFQDGQAPGLVTQFNGGVVTQAVNDVTAAGALFFSSAGNEGNKPDGTAGVWEGDFVDGGAAGGALAGAGRVHDFGGQLFDRFTVSGGNPIFLHWSDPLGGSNNDYDLYVLNSAGTAIVNASTGNQDGSVPQDPVEAVNAPAANSRFVIVKFSGAARFLELNTFRGQLQLSTNGQTHGHSAAALAFSCAATPAGTPFGAPPNPVGPFPSPFNTGNKAELFSSDGPRHLFYKPDSTPFTPGNVSSTGGSIRQKPDITAADGVSVTGVGGFPSTFYGTSAAAPHGAAIASLLKQAGPALTQAQIRTILTTTVTDIEAGGYDNLSGFGILNALAAVQTVNPTPMALLTLGTVTATEGSFNNGNGFVEPGETANIVAQILNPSMVAATNVQATLSTTFPGVTVISAGPRSYGNIAAAGNASNTASPFVISLLSSVPCGSTIPFTLTVTFGGGVSPVDLNLSITVGQLTHTIMNGALTGGDLQQTARMGRDSNPSSCNGTKTCPGPLGTGPRLYDIYSFPNSTPNPQCVIITLTASCSAATNPIMSAAYLGTFNPANLCTNYVGDLGTSPPASTSYSVVVPASKTLLVNVHEVNPGLAGCSGYTLDVAMYVCAAPPVCNATITCPADVTAVAAATCPISAGTVVNYATPTIVCPGVTVTCNPPSGSTFPVGTTTVTCTNSANANQCTFKVTVSSFCLQDETNLGNVVRVNALTGDYTFCCNGVPIASGRGSLTTRGCIGSINDTKGDRKVQIQWDTSANSGAGSGTAAIFKSTGTFICQITDKKMTNNTCVCSPPAASPAKSK